MPTVELAVESPRTITDRVPERPALPPGPRGPSVVTALRMLARPTAFLTDCARRYGDCFTLRFPGAPPHVLFSHPEAVREIMTADPGDLPAGEANAELGPLLGWNSLLVLDGARHLRERRLMLPPFHGERMVAYGRAMREITERALDALPLGQEIRIHSVMQGITLDVIVRTVFGVEDGERSRELRARLDHLLALANTPIAAIGTLPAFQVDLGRFSPWGQFVRAIRALDALLYAEIARRQTSEAHTQSDVLSMLVEARDEQGNGMSPQELRDQMFTLLMAGHETTAGSLAWTLARVLDRPDVIERIRAELRTVVGDAPLEPQHVARLEYLDAVVKESLRLDPVVHLVQRLVKKPTRIGGQHLPAGALAAPCIYLAHRRLELWPDPERFDPDRFVGARPNPYGFFPFGGGTRRCIGAAFATYEMKVILAVVFSRLDLRLAEGYRPRTVRRTITAVPSRGTPVVVLERR
jgi:cytochrome P450